MKRGLTLLLAVLLLALLLTGCGGEGGSPAASSPDESPAPGASPEPGRNLSWAKAFLDDSLPEGSLSPEEIAFYTADGENGAAVINLPREEVLAWWEAQETLPRTHFFEQFMPERLADLLPILDYAFAHSYSRFCVPSTSFTANDVSSAWKYLPLTYRINNNGISTLTPASFNLGEGKTLQYVTLTLRGMDRQGEMSEYRESIAAAREIVAGIPEGSSEYDKALYLYQWLTDHVRYDSGEYYENEWNLLYDTLIKKQTVCAGYTEALYVMYNLAGIECFTIGGNLYQNGSWGSHIWNVARIDGDYYLFDSTWDAGRLPERYRFFGVSTETMESYSHRLLLGNPEEYCPPCVKDLPLPGGGPAPIPAALGPGTVENGVYSQPFLDLELRIDDSWTVATREEILATYYGVEELSMETAFQQGFPYVDLLLYQGTEYVQLLLEQAPVQAENGQRIDDAESYIKALKKLLPNELALQGFRVTEIRRIQREFCGRDWEALVFSSRAGRQTRSQIILCAEKDGFFLSVFVVAPDADRADEILQQLG